MISLSLNDYRPFRLESVMPSSVNGSIFYSTLQDLSRHTYIYMFICVCICVYLCVCICVCVFVYIIYVCVFIGAGFLISFGFCISVSKYTRIYRLTMERFARTASGLAETLVKILAENLRVKFTYFQENCPPSSSYLRLNRYPPCPYSSSELVCGLIPHTDTDFLSVVYQNRIGGLQLLKDGRWFGVNPNPEALIINIGDLFQALSNGVYKSVKHRVVASEHFERFSSAYFYCPTNEAMVESHGEPAIYRKFSFKEYKQQSQKDVEVTGAKVGLQRFLQ